jgi:hypothetical protein
LEFQCKPFGGPGDTWTVQRQYEGMAWYVFARICKYSSVSQTNENWASERPDFPFPTRTEARGVAAECQLQKSLPKSTLTYRVFIFVSSPRILEANEVRYKSQTEQGRRFARAARHRARKGRRRRAHDSLLQSKVIQAPHLAVVPGRLE